MELGSILSGIGTYSGAANQALQGFGGQSNSTLSNIGSYATQAQGILNSFNGQSSGSAASTISLPSASSGSNTGSNVLAGAGSGAALGATIGSVFPGVGNAVGAVVGGAIGALTGLLSTSHHGVPGHEKPDLLAIAQKYDITFNWANDITSYKESHDSANFDDICARAANDASYYEQIRAEYNTAHPGGEIKPLGAQASDSYADLQTKAATMFAGTGVASPLASLSLVGAQQAAASQSMSLEDYIKALLNGALQGASAGAGTAAANTPAGQAATNSVLKDQAKKYELVIVAAGLGIAALAYKAFKK